MRKKILLCNDDGIHASGMSAMVEALADLADLYIIAPSKQQSAVSHKITLHKPLRIDKHHIKHTSMAYGVSGTPADCIKLALNHLLDFKPDLVVSGINNGSNSGYNMLYSGTVSAAMEAMINGAHAMAISLCATQKFEDYTLSKQVLKQLVENFFEHGMDHETFLNINVPPVMPDECQGVEFCYLSKNRYMENFEHRQDPSGRSYFWLGGKRLEIDSALNVDDVLIGQNKVAVVPIKLQFTLEHQFEPYKKWRFDSTSTPLSTSAQRP